MVVVVLLLLLLLLLWLLLLLLLLLLLPHPSRILLIGIGIVDVVVWRRNGGQCRSEGSGRDRGGRGSLLDANDGLSQGNKDAVLDTAAHQSIVVEIFITPFHHLGQLVRSLCDTVGIFVVPVFEPPGFQLILSRLAVGLVGKTLGHQRTVAFVSGSLGQRPIAKMATVHPGHELRLAEGTLHGTGSIDVAPRGGETGVVQ